MFIISIHPQHVQNILAGSKTVECRKSSIGLREGDSLLLYATAPTKAILGTARVAALHRGSPQHLWEQFRDVAGVTEKSFFTYYAQAQQAVLIGLSDVKALPAPIPLSRLRDIQPRFSPPQTARRLGEHFRALLA